MCLQNSKNKNIRDLYRGINEFKKVYQPQSIIMKDKNGDLLADSDSIFNRRKNCSHLLNMCVRQIEIHTAEPLVCGPILLRLKLLL
jgi:hypothetical protein